MFLFRASRARAAIVNYRSCVRFPAVGGFVWACGSFSSRLAPRPGIRLTCSPNRAPCPQYSLLLLARWRNQALDAQVSDQVPVMFKIMSVIEIQDAAHRALAFPELHH